MKSIFQSIKTFNWRLWLVIAITLFVPSLYKTLRIYFLGDMPNEWGVNIASQLSWVNLIYEILEEGLILPMFFLLGKSFNSKEEIENKTRVGLIISSSMYAVLSALIFALAKPLCNLMASNSLTIKETVTYIRIESVASTISILSKFIVVVFITMKKDKYMYILLTIQTSLFILFDTFLISKLKVSANIGVNGIAISNIIVSLVLVIMAVVF
ncbi:hypothetical protein [Metamycoplasma hyosynoviae]|nr:hypothetical protein [Metamycoplasma hyosynoviae]MDD7847295.1 hypothetical protein [Metamycoplasma hyosynoviae]MDD7894063.1 hypothetical protein [Metamycoplasma hyosynoviae]